MSDHSQRANFKVLVVCYAFPPYPGIGGRRWAKFAKYLRLGGCEVVAIGSANPYAYKSEWTSDVTEIQRATLPLNYPKSLILYPTGLKGRIRYQLDLLFVKLFAKGNYYDRTVFWQNRLLEQCRRLIREHHIKNVIITGAPFSLLRVGPPLRREFKDLNLIADIRDPWTNNETAYSYDLLSPRRRAFEQASERSVFHAFNHVITVSPQLTDYFKNLYPRNDGKFQTIPNGFDPDDALHALPNPGLLDVRYKNLVFAGSFYDKAVYLFKNVLSCFASSERLRSAIKMTFVGPSMEKLSAHVPAALQANFQFHPSMDTRRVNGLLKEADYAMLFLTDDINYSLSTKFCEYVKFRKKIVLFSKDGMTADFIVKNELGYHVRPGHECEDLESLTEKGKDDLIPETFNVEAFSLPAITKQVTGLLVE